MCPTSEPHGGISAGELAPRAPYLDSQPAGHTRVCWSAAIGRASRGGRSHTTDYAEIITIATADLVDHPETCICTRPRRRRGRSRR